VEEKLSSLQEKDNNLHNKFFASVSNFSPSTHTEQTKSNILLADAPSFSEFIIKIGKSSRELINASAHTSTDFSERLSLDKNDLDAISSLPLHLPIRDLTPEKLLSGFGKRINPFHKGLYEHEGIDIALPRGTEVLAPSSGKIIAVRTSMLQAGYGNYIEIDHGSGFITRYAHLEELKVRNGQRVEKGQVIATTGNSGGSVAPHLHYEIIRNGLNVDPVLYMISGVSTELHEAFRSVSNKENQSLD
jgi:murein DD-endopeptidase MepM/ murein hydrolase activator NlpD